MPLRPRNLGRQDNVGHVAVGPRLVGRRAIRAHARPGKSSPRATSRFCDSYRAPVDFDRYRGASRYLSTTQRCLHAIRAALENFAVEIVVVDGGSDRRISDYLMRCIGVRITKGPIDAAMAQGKYICLLDGDTFVHPGWLSELLRVCESDERIAVAGSQVRFPNGRVAPGAGGIIWRDGSICMYGRVLRPRNANVAFRRDVDYCSRASFLVRSDVFERLGGFDSEGTLGGYADAELCMGVHQAGYRVVYVPTSVVTCLGVASDETEEQRAGFEAKWSSGPGDASEGLPR